MKWFATHIDPTDKGGYGNGKPDCMYQTIYTP